MTGEHPNTREALTTERQLKRYELYFKDELGYRGEPSSEQNLDGEWVKYEDIETMARDAARYRWLKQHADAICLDVEVNYMTDTGQRIYVRSVGPSELDRAVDGMLP